MQSLQKPLYSHTQSVPLHLFFAIAVLLVTVASLRQGFSVLTILVGIAVVFWFIFSRMTISVSEQALDFCFGFNFMHKTIKLDEIASYKQVRNSPLSGWGIHYIGTGWLYNVYGLSAVELHLKDGSMLRLGTDEPAKLVEALDLATTKTNEQS